MVEGTGGEEEGGEREEVLCEVDVVLLAEVVLGEVDWVGEEVVPDVTVGSDAVVDGATDVACADVAGTDVAGALDDMMVKVGYQRLEIKKGVEY